MIKSCVVGHPIKHSLSPKLHGYWLSKYSVDGSYEHFEIKPDNFANDFKGLASKGYKGCNVTVPYKQDVYEICDKLSNSAKKIGAVNTILFKDGLIIGDNTDAYGFIENIKNTAINFNFKNSKAVVLGAGGASRAVVFGLLESGVSEVFLLNRTKDRAAKLANDMDGKVSVIDWEERNNILSEADLLVNTTSLGMQGEDELPINMANLPKHAIVTDIVYKPLITPFLQKAIENGNKVVDGLGMLLYQAVPGFELWFGKRPDVDKNLRQIILEA